MPESPQIKLTQTDGDHGLRFAGPDLLDYTMIFEVNGGIYDGERLRIDSSYHPCCGTLDVRASLLKVYVRWRNKLDGCKQHQRDREGDRELRRYVWEIETLIERKSEYQQENFNPSIQ